MLHSPSQKINLVVFDVVTFGEEPIRYRVSAKFDENKRASVPSIQWLRDVKDWRFTTVPEKLIGKTIEFEHIMLRGCHPHNLRFANTWRGENGAIDWSSPNDPSRFFILIFKDVLENVIYDNGCTIVSKETPQRTYLRKFNNLITEDENT